MKKKNMEIHVRHFRNIEKQKSRDIGKKLEKEYGIYNQN